MAVIRGDRETIKAVGEQFVRGPLPKPLFLNSVPKSGTHLLLNIVRMFVAPEYHWRDDAIQLPTLRQNFGAFSPKDKYLSWGHLLFDDQAALAMKWVNHIVLVRDPYDLALARARFYLSDEFDGDLNHLKNGTVSAEQLLNMVILGVFQKIPPLLDTYMHNAAAWMGTEAHMVRYEDVKAAVARLDKKEGETYLRDLLAKCGIETLPGDWKDRVRAGADPKNSRTSRENLTGNNTIPDVLPPIQKKLVDFAAPGLRALLGYN